MHVFGSLAIYMQMQAGIMDMNGRGLMKHALPGKAAIALVASFTALTGFIVVIFIIATHKRLPYHTPIEKKIR